MDEIKFSKNHIWVKVEEGIAKVGITDHGQKQLKDIVFVELPQSGNYIKKDDKLFTLESVKSAAEVVSPVSGSIGEVNSELEDNPTLLNEKPMDTWIAKIRLRDPKELDDLISEDKYKEFTK